MLIYGMERGLFVRLLVVLAGGAASVVSCSELETLTATFKMNHTADITILGLQQAKTPFDLKLLPITILSEAQFYDTNVQAVREIYIEKASVRIKSPGDRNLSFLQSLHVFIVQDGLPTRLLAFQDSIGNEAGQVIDLETSTEDFNEYIKNEGYTLQFRTITDSVISDDIDLTVESRFLIVADLWD